MDARRELLAAHHVDLEADALVERDAEGGVEAPLALLDRARHANVGAASAASTQHSSGVRMTTDTDCPAAFGLRAVAREYATSPAATGVVGGGGRPRVLRSPVLQRGRLGDACAVRDDFDGRAAGDCLAHANPVAAHLEAPGVSRQFLEVDVDTVVLRDPLVAPGVAQALAGRIRRREVDDGIAELARVQPRGVAVRALQRSVYLEVRSSYVAVIQQELALGVAQARTAHPDQTALAGRVGERAGGEPAWVESGSTIDGDDPRHGS